MFGSIITFLSTGIIILSIVWAYIYIAKQNKNNLLNKKRRWIEQLPSLISTLGVLGTFLGITIGLLAFNEGDLTQSIPELLNGMKTAFFTSLAGMVGSLMLSRYVNRLYDEQDNGVSDINQAAKEIVSAVNEMNNVNSATMNLLIEQMNNQVQNQNVFYSSMNTMINNIHTHLNTTDTNISSILVQTQSQSTIFSTIKEDIATQKDLLSSGKNILSNLEENTSKLADLTENIEKITGNIEEFAEVQKDNTTEIKVSTQAIVPVVNDISTNIGETVDIVSGISTTQDEIEDEVKNFAGILHGEVVEIEDKMKETNQLLNKKFDEFTELLKKSNTEALVEVMKNVTEEFQKQMNSLINKLIQENFEQLNTSVERLNTWQQENKEMIASLISQYKNMADNFEGTSTTLTKVGDDTKLLVSSGGKLEQLISALNKVIIEDSKFIEITTKLTQTVELTKNNMESFDSSTKSLNDWVKKQRNFVDGVNILIEKLEELNKIKDYGEQFWRSTKEKLEEGVGYISNGSRTLNDQLRELDKQFYARLSATLAELDTCIQALITNNRQY